MRYPIVIERGDDTHAYGVVVPDLPGCFSAGDTLEEAFDMAKEAVEGWLEVCLDDGAEIPKPSSLEAISNHSDYQGWILGTVDVDLSKLSDKAERVNITLPQRVLRRLDALANKAGDTRSGYIARMVLEGNS
ncbi:type II toxin-antitoxin system HicB family antitoxin [Sutterella sp.]|uniref:type II toxin-antitoxin system HicB family antitoxin n=1 Tax=Sutterella sp. TaxID=1981025 RepID=UPI003FD8CF68